MWTIISIIISFIASMIVLVTPIIKLIGAITKLDTTVTLLNGTITDNEAANKSAHKEFYKRLDNLENKQTELKTKMNIYHEQ